MAEKWIQKMHLKRGALTRTAKRSGKSFRELAKSKNKLTAKRARLAMVFRAMARRRKHRGE